MIGAIILAAGESRRLGYPKQEICYKGKSLLVRAIESVLSECDGPVVVVLGAPSGRICKLLEDCPATNLQTVMNDNWMEGMGSSIACGMKALLETGSPIDAVLISLCDQPHLNPDIIGALVSAWHESSGSIVASGYTEAVGPPVVFPAKLFSRIQACSGEKGARQLLKENADILQTVQFPALAFDIDTPEQHQSLQELDT